jgi:beta-glucosidase-like glycosyl hydrolase
MSAASPAARLFFPALRWDEARGFDGLRPEIDAALDLGVGGFSLFGGMAEAVASLTAELRRRSRHPLLIAADLERGAGQQFRGATSLPPPAVFGALDDVELSRRAGRVTARDARALGVNWIYAPVADLDVEAENPIVGTRAFGEDAEQVARHVKAWIEGCREGGALACVKHFPGHGRTTTDSHLGLPRVSATRSTLERDLTPFRAAIEAGVDAVMTAHVAYPALDASGLPATLSRPMIGDLLRDGLGHDGVVVTDALIMKGVLEDAGEAEAAIGALAAGCDALLYPQQLEATLRAVEAAVGERLPESRVREALARIEAAADRVAGLATGEDAGPSARSGAGVRGGHPPVTGGGEAGDDAAWALDMAVRGLRSIRGEPRSAPEVEVLVVDDDVGGPFPLNIPRTVFADTLASSGVVVHPVERATGEWPVLVALFADIRGFKGRPGVSSEARRRLHAAVSSASTVVVLFGPPRLAGQVSGSTVLCAWGGDPLMQRAAAQWLSR